MKTGATDRNGGAGEIGTAAEARAGGGAGAGDPTRGVGAPVAVLRVRPVHGLGRRELLRLVAAGGVLAGLGVSGTARASEQGVDAPLSQLYSALEALMREGRATPFRQRFYRVAPVIDRAFDLDSILRGSVGTVWLSLDPSSQTALLNAFRRFTIASYVVNFDRYDGERFEVLAGQRAVGSDQVVQTRIVQGDGEPIRLDYVMRDSQAGWRAVDVLMDGTISRVAVQRSDFRALIRRGDASALIASLQRKTVDLAGSNSFDS